jgi:hypothetical protein
MKNLRFTRRNLIKGLGMGSAAHMLLPDLYNPAYGAEAVPKNFIMLYSYHGDCVDNGSQASLWGNGSGGLTLGEHLQPLNAYKNDMVLVGGLTMESANLVDDGHNAGHIKGQVHSLTSIKPPTAVYEGARPNAGGPSIDQAILALLKQKNGGQQLTPVDSIQLAIMDNTFEGQMMGRAGYLDQGGGRIKALAPLQDPNIAWYQLFKDFGATAPPPDGGPVAEDPKRTLRRIVSQFTRGQFDGMASKVQNFYGADSRDRFQAHVDYMRDLETSLAKVEGGGGMIGGGGGMTGGGGMPSASCTVPARDAVPKKPSAAGGWVNVLSENMPKLLHLAIACGRTRFATLNIEESVTADPGIHEKVHNRDVGGTKAYYTQVSKEVAKVFKLLKETPTADGKNLLYHSVVLWAGELGKGDHSWNGNVNWVVAGQAGGALQTGRYVDGKGRFTSDLFVSLGKLMDSGMTTFGDPRALKGPLTPIKA